MKRLLVQAELCAGCRLCEMVCSFHHERVFSPTLSRIHVIKKDAKGLDYPVFCRQCPSCPPEKSCVTKAFRRNGEGVFWLDEDLCTKCGICESTCTFNAVKLDNNFRPIVCDLCGSSPECSERCPTGALKFEETEFFEETPITAFERMLSSWGIE